MFACHWPALGSLSMDRSQCTTSQCGIVRKAPGSRARRSISALDFDFKGHERRSKSPVHRNRATASKSITMTPFDRSVIEHCEHSLRPTDTDLRDGRERAEINSPQARQGTTAIIRAATTTALSNDHAGKRPDVPHAGKRPDVLQAGKRPDVLYELGLPARVAGSTQC